MPLNGQAEDLDELILILRKTTAQPVTLIDPRAHLDGATDEGTCGHAFL